MNIEFSKNKDRDVAYNNQRAIPRNNPCLNVTESARLPLNAGKFHTDLKLEACVPVFPQERNMFDVEYGYTWLKGVRKGKTSGTIEAYWDELRNENIRVDLRQWVFPAESSELLLASAPVFWPTSEGEALCSAKFLKEMKRSEYPPVKFRPQDTLATATQLYVPLMISRAVGKKASFLTILAPTKGNRRITEIQRLDIGLDGRQLSPADGVAFRIKLDDQYHMILLCPEKGVKRFGSNASEKTIEAMPSF